MIDSDEPALVEIGQWLRSTGYQFVTVTPATHERVNKRDLKTLQTVEDIFGWSRPFEASALPDGVLALLERAGAVIKDFGRLRSAVRFSTLDGRLYIHSAYPTVMADAVFFGPDSYRFAAFIKASFLRWPALGTGHIVDVGCGTGVGGTVAYDAARAPKRLTLTDISGRALRCARISAAINEIGATFWECDLFQRVEQPIDVIVANPPYLPDREQRLYRHGGGSYGAELSIRIVREGLSVLSPGGALLLYTGSCIVEGKDFVREAIEEVTRGAPVEVDYSELDPDVFGEELDSTGYDQVDRIAAVGAVIRCTRPRSGAARSVNLPPSQRP